MGITINSKNNSIDIGYFGFRQLRIKIAELTTDDIAKHYKELENAILIFSETERKKYFKKYDEKTDELDKKYNYKYKRVLNFLYSSDCEAKIDVDICKELYEIIKEYDDDIKYGYSGRSDCAMFNDFKELILDCINSDCYLEWS